MGKNYAYVRVSTKNQNTDRQLIEMKKLHISKQNIFQDKQSGKDFERPQYQRMLTKLKEGDTLFVLSIDRLGRNYEEIQEQWRLLTKDIGADIVVIDMPLLDTRRGRDLLGTFVSDLVLQVLSFCADNERQNITTRQREGIEAARGKGVHFGRDAAPLSRKFFRAYEGWRRGDLSVREAAEKCGMPKSTFYQKAKKLEDYYSCSRN